MISYYKRVAIKDTICILLSDDVKVTQSRNHLFSLFVLWDAYLENIHVSNSQFLT